MTGTAPRLLSGLRILEIGHYVAAPFATRILADLGADVIKIEPRGGDPVRKWGAQINGKSLWWSVHGRNKRCVTLDLKHERARDIVKGLASHCDAVIENFRPGQLAKLGLGPDVLRQARPDLVITHISGYGQTGPYRDRAAFGVIGEALGGLRHLTDHPPGTSDLPPVRVGVSIGDSMAALYAVIGTLAALWQRDRVAGDGQPRTLDVALTESVLSLMEGMLPEYGALGLVKQPTGGGIATAAPSNAYPTSDGAFLLIAANSEPLFARLAGLMGETALVADPRFVDNPSRVVNAAELDRRIGSWTARHAAEDLLAILTLADIPSSRLFTAADIARDPQYRARGMIHEVPDAAFGRNIMHPGVVPHVNDDDAAIRWPGPEIGAHNREVLEELLGLSSEEIDQLISEGAV